MKSLISVSECDDDNDLYRDFRIGGCDRTNEYCKIEDKLEDNHCVPFSGKLGFNLFAYSKCSHLSVFV